ncbi:MAG: 50S ribosomal protein L11 methyltransferase [Pseudomonadota bacterium]
MFKASVSLPASLNEINTAVLAESAHDLCVSYSALRENNNKQSDWVLEWLFDEEADLSALKARLEIAAEIHDIQLPQNLELAQDAVPERDWLRYSYKQFPPFSVGPFFIYGSHSEGEVPEGQIGLQIDAASAFGSGEHGTTKGCLQAMLDLKGQGACPWNILDMGTGSGILTVAAWKLWKTPVMAVDIEEESIRVADHHIALNDVPTGEGNVRTLRSDGFGDKGVERRAPYDLIIANILVGPLKAMAKDLVTAADENGYVILSGLLHEQVESVLEIYEPLGLVLKKTLQIDEWSTLLLHKPAA